LDLVPNSCTSFLNIGSGTGYVSAIVASILGPNSLNYGMQDCWFLLLLVSFIIFWRQLFSTCSIYMLLYSLATIINNRC
jgi:hypothetical protein